MNKLKTIVFEIDKAFILTGFLLLFIDQKIFLEIFSFGGHAIPKVSFIFQFYVFWDDIMRFLQDLWKKIPKFEFEVEESSGKIDGIDTKKLVEYMFESGKLAYEDLKNMFGLSTQKYKKLGCNLEKIGLLKRGENNARVLKDGLDKFEVFRHLTQFNNSDTTTPLLHREGNSAKVV